MSIRLSPGCNCCGGGTPPEPPPDNCEIVYGQTWPFGTATYMKTFHRDFTATYLDYVQTEERSFDAGNNPTGTVVVGQVYNNNYSSAGAAVESSELDVFFSGEFIANPVDTFVSENFVSTVPDGLGGVIETWEVHYNRQASVRESTGLAFFRSVYFTEDARAETNKLKAQYYVNDDTSGASGQYTLAGRDNKTTTLVATADHLTRAVSAYSVDPGSIGGIKVNAFSTNIKGETQAAIEAITTAAGAQALRGASGPGLYESFYWSGTETQSIFDVNSVTNGAEPTFTLLGEKPTTVIGPAGGGWIKSRIVCGWEDYFNTTPLWGTYPERPDFGIWELVSEPFAGAYDFIVPSEHGFRITADEAYQTRFTGLDVVAGTTYSALDIAFGFDAISGSQQGYSGGACPRGLLTQSVDRARFVNSGDFSNLPEAGVFPLPIAQVNPTFFSRELAFAWSRDIAYVTSVSGWQNYPHARVDSGTDWSARFESIDNEVQMSTSLIGEDSTGWFWDGTDQPTNDIYTGGDYLVRLNDVHEIQSVENITILKYNGTSEEVTCEEIPECSVIDDLASMNVADDWRDHARFGIQPSQQSFEATAGVNQWYLLDRGVSNTSRSIVTGKEYAVNIINREPCTSELLHTFDGTYTQDEGVMDYKVVLSGTRDNMTWETTCSLRHWMSGSVLDGPYTFTASGIDLTTMTTNSETTGQLTLTLGIGETFGGTAGNDKVYVIEGYPAASSAIFDGTLDVGSNPPTPSGTVPSLVFTITGSVQIVD